MVKENIARITESIAAASSVKGHGSDKITIVAVSKGRSIDQIKEAVDAGIPDIGENRVQEAVLKHKELSVIRYTLSAIRWHMVGHLQTNKVKDAVMIFDLIHSVDSLRLAIEIDKQALKINKIQDILIEVNTSGEESKYGIRVEEAGALARSVSELKNVRLLGLMTLAHFTDDPESTRPYFRMLRELRDKIAASKDELRVLSMGMTDDFKVAVEEGSNMVRIGRAIFEG